MLDLFHYGQFYMGMLVSYSMYVLKYGISSMVDLKALVLGGLFDYRQVKELENLIDYEQDLSVEISAFSFVFREEVRFNIKDFL